jgi:hypothetical protein
MHNDLITPFERGNANQTSSWQECIAYYELLAARFPTILQFSVIGHSDAGNPIHAGLVSSDGVFDRAAIKAAGRPVFFNNNGIHPGEPEGVDQCMAHVRDLCTDPARLAALGSTVLLFVPVYNVDGSLNRANTSRVNQQGPEQFGFRGNARHLDLNRDFIKADSLNTKVFNQLITSWDPEVMVDTHTSNGADYPYTMTLIHTQADKLGGSLGSFLRDSMLPHIFCAMEQAGWPTCPYVNPVKQIPDLGIAEFLESPRFSTGFAALHHVIGFMPETHMLKPFADRYASMRTLVEVVLAFTVKHGAQIQALRRADRASACDGRDWPVHWTLDEANPGTFRFKGYEARHHASVIGHYTRLSYDRSKPWERDIPYYNRFAVDVAVPAPRAYVLPQAWREVVERLQWNGVQMEQLQQARVETVQAYHIKSVRSRAQAYEGHLFHDEMQLEKRSATVTLQAGDYWIPLGQDNARYAVETLEPQGHDSFFRWGFFNSVLEKKEAYSDYVFEDHASELLRDEPELAKAFSAWKELHPELLADQVAVLDFIFTNCKRYAEPDWRRYPVLSVM